VADKVLIQPLDLADFDPSTYPSDPGFADLVNQELTDSGTPADGFDGVWEDLVAIVDALEEGMILLGGADGGDLDDTFAEILELDPTEAGDHVALLSAAIPDVQTNVDNLGTLLGGPPLPGPVTGGGGTRPATCGSLDMGSHLFQVAGNVNFVTVTVGLTNNQSKALTVKGTTWTPAQTFGFRVIPDIAGSVIQPGATLPINIVAGNGGVGTTRATLTVNTDGPDPQPCLNVTAEWTAGSGGGRVPDCVKCADWSCPPT
jgi:hypothetical protein